MEIIKKFSKYRNKLILKNIYGEVSYFIKNNTIILSNLHINEKYRKQGYGSILLNTIEKENPDFKIFKLCAWEPTHSPHVVKFYEKNGYFLDKDAKIEYYDDGETIFDLVPMTKIINI